MGYFGRLLSASGGGGPSFGAEITDLHAAVTGGTSSVLAFYSTNFGVTVNTGVVEQWDDARGSSGYGPAMTSNTIGGRPAWDSTNKLITSASTLYLVTAASALFDLSGPKTLIYVGTVEQKAAQNPDYIAGIASDGAASPDRLMGILNDTGFSSGNIIGLVLDTGFKYGSSGVALGTTRRCVIATKGSAANTFTIQVPDQAANAGGTSSTGGSVASGNNGLALFAYGAGASVNSQRGVGSARALIVIDHAVDSTEAAAIQTWAENYHGVTAA